MDDERILYQNALTQVELADTLGYDYAWEVEHHFLEEYSHSPAPEVFLAAASQRTKNIRLGHGIVQLTTNPPQRVAERIACLDLVSNGRVEFGTGESGSVTELGGFGHEMETKRELWEDLFQRSLPADGNRRMTPELAAVPFLASVPQRTIQGREGRLRPYLSVTGGRCTVRSPCSSVRG